MGRILFAMNPSMCFESVVYMTRTSNHFLSARRDMLGLPSRRGSLRICSFPISIDALTMKPCGCPQLCHTTGPPKLIAWREVTWFCVAFCLRIFSCTDSCVAIQEYMKAGTQKMRNELHIRLLGGMANPICVAFWADLVNEGQRRGNDLLQLIEELDFHDIDSWRH